MLAEVRPRPLGEAQRDRACASWCPARELRAVRRRRRTRRTRARQKTSIPVPLERRVEALKRSDCTIDNAPDVAKVDLDRARPIRRRCPSGRRLGQFFSVLGVRALLLTECQTDGRHRRRRHRCRSRSACDVRAGVDREGCKQARLVAGHTSRLELGACSARAARRQ